MVFVVSGGLRYFSGPCIYRLGSGPELLSTAIGVDYVVIGFDMEVQPLVTHSAA